MDRMHAEMTEALQTPAPRSELSEQLGMDLVASRPEAI